MNLELRRGFSEAKAPRQTTSTNKKTKHLERKDAPGANE